MKPDDTSDPQLDIIRLSDEGSDDDAAQQLTAYARKAQMFLQSWRHGFHAQEANQDYQLEDGEDIKLRSGSASQLLAEHTLADGTRIRFDYDDEREEGKLVVAACEANGEMLTVASPLADQYDQLAGLLYTCASLDKSHKER